jgi:hypothetical protein
MARTAGADQYQRSALLLPRSLDSCHPSGRGRGVKARAATAKRPGLDTPDSAETIERRGDGTARFKPPNPCRFLVTAR